MKKSKNKPLFAAKSSLTNRGKSNEVHTIKLQAVTIEERQRLRISSYQYILP